MEVLAFTLKLILSLSSFKKMFNSLNSIAENLIIALTFGKTMCIFEIYFSQIGFYLARTFSWGNTIKIPKIFRGFAPNPTRTLPGPTGGITAPPKPPLIIDIAARSFSQNSKKNWPANLSLFKPLLIGVFWIFSKLQHSRSVCYTFLICSDLLNCFKSLGTTVITTGSG